MFGAAISNRKMEYKKVFILFILPSLVLGNEMAKLYGSRNVIMTSSTLAWVSVKPGESFPPNAVPIGSGGPLWCRASEHSIWLSGAVVERKCRVPFMRNVYVIDDFDVLVSLNGSARLINVSWDSLEAFPPNRVATPDMLLALTTDSEGGAVLPGFVDVDERRAYFMRGNDTIKLNHGSLVTEKEPVRYQLENVRLGEDIVPLVHEEVLQEFTMENYDVNPREVRREVTFISPHLVYFGRMKGTIVALPTEVSGPHTFPVSIKWGIENNLDWNRTVPVTHKLPGQSTVTVRLIAVIRNLEATYYGRLTSVYDDGVELERTITGLHTERKLAELRADFGQTKSVETQTDLALHPPHSMVILQSTTTTLSPLLDLNNQNALNASASSLIFPRSQEFGVNGVVRLTSLWVAALLLFLHL